jgi:alkylation response protein AidB-like acyl-CoA dehydrogenase
MNERVSIGGSIPAKGSGVIRDLVDMWQQLPGERKDPATLDQVMKLWSRAEILRLTNIRANQSRKMGDPGPEGSIGKGASAELNKDLYDMVVTLMGADGMLYGSYDMTQPSRTMGFETMQKAFLRTRANSIEGGTTEVMKNILGERVLGLPGDVRVDRDRPWSEVPRN